MNKKTLVLVLVLALVAICVGGLLFKDRIKDKVRGKVAERVQEEKMETVKDQTAEKEEVKTAENLVELTESGFSPLTITVKKGTTVKFVNKTGNRMSVASDPHPQHTIYPEFDQYKTSFKGQNEFDFTFDRVGTWGYHNHMNEKNIGTVVVVE